MNYRYTVYVYESFGKIMCDHLENSHAYKGSLSVGKE